MKHSAEYERFTSLVDRVLAVPHSVLKQRIEEDRKRIDANPSKPGPKRKASVKKPSASGRAVTS
jgi:hypothetical protein